MYYVYILQSIGTGKYYVGHTQDIQVRVGQHNKGRVRSTKSGMPWKLVYEESYDSKAKAFRREMQIKSYKGGNAFQKLVNN